MTDTALQESSDGSSNTPPPRVPQSTKETGPSTAQLHPASSLLFQPYRAIGYVSSEIPFDLQVKGSDYFLTTVIGDSFQVYNCKKLNLVFVGHVGRGRGTIQALACGGNTTYAAAKNIIVAKQRDDDVQVFEGHHARIHTVLPFGEHVISVDDDNVLHVFHSKTAEIVCTIDDLSAAKFKISCLLHPSTYLNKILIASKQGKLQLWNIKTRKLVYTFSGWNAGVSALAQSPVVDVIAVGTESGHVYLHNLKYDDEVAQYHHEGGVITGISFRTDGKPIMATASTQGSVAVWDLEAKRLSSVINAHTMAVSSLQFLHSKPILLTSSRDNSIKMWAFDTPDGSARLLKSREGHSQPPTKVRYYGDTGYDMISCAADRSLRYICTIQDQRSTEFSQGKLAHQAKLRSRTVESLRLPPIVDFDAVATRERDWSNVITAHRDRLSVQAWSYQKKAISSLELRPPKLGSRKGDRSLAATETYRKFPSAATVCMSACGNFVLVGYTNGRVQRFNIQSGRSRGNYSKGSENAHKSLITGIAVDATNSFVVTASKDGFLKCWSFRGKLKYRVNMKTPLLKLTMNANNNIVAVAGADFVIRLFDAETRKVVRAFGGHEARVTDMAWSPDGRWLVSASADLSIRIWDVPTGRMLSWFATPQAATSIAFSPQGDYLATTHVDQVGVFLWVNRSLFAPVAHKFFTKEELRDGKPPMVPLAVSGGLPTHLGNGLDEEDVDDITDYLKAFEVDESSLAPEDVSKSFKSREQIADELITLSSLPASRWLNLTKLDVIRERNKPKEAPKLPERAPFFLQTSKSLAPEFKAVSDPLAERQKKDLSSTSSSSHIINFSKIGALSAFQRALITGYEGSDFGEVDALITKMGISAIDGEIRSLDGTSGPEMFAAALAYFTATLSSNRNFELVQAHANLFLTVHMAEMQQYPELQTEIAALQRLQHVSWTKLDGMFQHALCMINYFKNPRL